MGKSGQHQDDRGGTASKQAACFRSLQVALASLVEGVVIVDARGRLAFVNEAGSRLAQGAPSGDQPLAGQGPHFQWRYLDGRPIPPAETPLAKALRGETVAEGMVILVRADGTEAYVAASARPVLDEQGKVAGAVATFRESEAPLAELRWQANEQLLLKGLELQKAAEREAALRVELERHAEVLRESEERYRQLVEFSPEAIFVHREGRIEFANGAAVQLLRGNSPEDIVGKPVLDLVAPGYRKMVRERIHRVVEEGTPEPLVEEEFLCLNGTPVPVEVAAIPFTYLGRPAVQVVARDITERKKADQFREEYAGLISHDLRNPLTSLMGTADLLRRGLARLGLERETLSAESILKSARRMAAMIADLGEAAHLESGHLHLRREPTDLANLVSELVERTGTREDGQRIVVEIPAPVPAVSVDKDRVERAITNLITNALKYSPADKPVVVRVEQHDHLAVIAVLDQGVGVAPEDLPHLFQRHFRARTAGRREGLGLGLYITRLVAEAHGGQVGVESEVGRGSTFYFTLPLVQED